MECAEPLIELGVKMDRMGFRDRSSPIITMHLSAISRYTRYPFALVLPQTITERILTKKLESLGVNVFRPRTVTGMVINAQDGNVVDVSFDDGQVIQASYVIGADGAKSAVCILVLYIHRFS